MAKGIAIATDTIVYIILAVIVLTVLLYFLTRYGGEGESRARLELDRGTQCGILTQYDRDCDEKVDIQGEDAKYNDAQTKLAEICKKLNVPKCSGSKDFACFRNCCLTCPTKT